MFFKLSRFSKAIAAAAVPAGALVADLAGQFSGITEDGQIVADEWKLLGAAVAAYVVTYLAPKNAPAPDPDNRL